MFYRNIQMHFKREYLWFVSQIKKTEFDYFHDNRDGYVRRPVYLL